MKLTDESWISYQQGKGNEEFQKYMEDLTDMQNHVPVSYTHLDVYKRQQYRWKIQNV